MLDLIPIKEKEFKDAKDIKNGIILITGDTGPSQVAEEYISKLACRFFIPSELQTKLVCSFGQDIMFTPKSIYEDFPILHIEYFANTRDKILEIVEHFNIGSKLLPITILILDGKPNIYTGIVKDSFLIEEIKKSEIGKKFRWFGEKW